MRIRVPEKWYEYITIPITWVAWTIGAGAIIGFLARVLLYPLEWGWAIAERLLQ